MSDDDSKYERKEKVYSWRDGMPTKPDVDLLIKAWPDPAIGDRFDYDVVEKVLGLSRDSDYKRMATITNAWRNRMERENELVIKCDHGKAFYVASADDVNADTGPTLISIGKMARKHRKKLVVVTKETDEQRSNAVHGSRLMHEIERHTKKARMNVLPSTKTPEPPAIEQGPKKINSL